MEEKKDLSHEPDQAAKAHQVRLMQMGYPWQKAAITAGLQISRSTAYRWVQAVQSRGEAALLDGRRGHPTKLREVMLQWLVTACRANPQMPSREVQAALQDQFGIHVSIGHLNRVRAQLGIGNHVGRSKKNSKRPLLHSKPNGRRVQAHCCWSLRHTRQDCWKP
jgi:transposase